MGCEVRSAKCEVWSAKRGVQSFEYRVYSVECGVLSLVCGFKHQNEHLVRDFLQFRSILTLWHNGQRTVFLASPIDTEKPKTPDETCCSVKTSISCETSCNIDKLQVKNRRFPTSFHKSPKICDLKIDVSCEDSGKFHHISQNATPAMQFALCHHFAQPCQCESQKTRNTTRQKYCACRRK